jgi:hypothetical protein
VLETEDGSIQGQSIGLSGKIRVVSPNSSSDAGGPR